MRPLMVVWEDPEDVQWRSEPAELHNHSVRRALALVICEHSKRSEPLELINHSVKRALGLVICQHCKRSEPLELHNHSVRRALGLVICQHCKRSEPLELHNHSVKRALGLVICQHCKRSEPLELHNHRVRRALSLVICQHCKRSEPAELHNHRVRRALSLVICQHCLSSTHTLRWTKPGQGVTGVSFRHNQEQIPDCWVCCELRMNNNSVDSERRVTIISPFLSNLVDGAVCSLTPPTIPPPAASHTPTHTHTPAFPFTLMLLPVHICFNDTGNFVNKHELFPSPSLAAIDFFPQLLTSVDRTSSQVFDLGTFQAVMRS
ncbi:hypothetical protein RRG08_009608 [Elysia crispata]|uniref:Uncharacterized protein n=1 Tax=Elysia crispata TaxID=231223 RepID=A0AAE0XTT4_9GAST|nr:hypothetical protein RRG08_009608 [Elysia crispata]